MSQELENITVQNLMDEDRTSWDREVLRDVFNERDMDLILKIPLPARDRQDAWFWHLEAEGIFTVKSCYQRQKGEHSMSYKDFWKKVWSLKLPGKVIYFLWRVLRACLPTATALAEKRVQIDVRCQWCLTSMENASHVLFECPFTRSVWTDTGMSNVIQVLQDYTSFEVLEKAFASCTKEQVVQIAMLCWSLWNRRNKWVWNKINMSYFGVQAEARNVLHDWRRVAHEKYKYKPVVQSSPKQWSPPPPG